MLSYLHSYHAGNLADVHKHGALARLLALMTQKQRPITYMETHAGRGLYDLSSPEAEKTSEARNGIERLLSIDTNRLEQTYLEAVLAVRDRYGPTFYPGSPLVARHLLRQTDSLHLMERHPREYPALKRALRGSGAHIHHRDGYEGVLALSPPTPRRGVVLIDPSYEVKDEYMKVANFIPALHKKWPEAVILLWYPILSDTRHKPMIERLSAAGLPETDMDETEFSGFAHSTGGGKGMLGSGLFLLNRPYGFDLKVPRAL